MGSEEMGVILTFVIAGLAWWHGYPRGYCDWILPNRLKKFKKPR